MKQSKMPADPNRRAKATADMVDAILNGERPAKDPGRVERGKASGAIGGRVRASKLTPERRGEIARKAAMARWGKS